MAAPAPQQTATGHGGSTLTTTAPPAYSEKEALGEGQAPMQPQVGEALPQAWPQGYAMPLAVGQTPFTVAAAAPPPDRPAPHDFFMLALVTTIICGILNLLSLAFGIPATIFAALSISAKSSKNYPQAKQHGRNALILTIINIFFTILLLLLIVGVITGYSCARPFSDYTYSASYYRNRLGLCRGPYS